ncbi:MAG TPA: hypothetical protein VIF60_05520 [Burkholderiaceae bacterium]
MKTLIRRTGILKIAGHKLLLPLAVAAAACTLFMTPAMAQHDDYHGRDSNHGHADNRGHDGWRDGHEGWRNGHEGWRDGREYRREYDERRWRDQHHPYYYAQPVYVPPAVYVEPQPSAGISIFLPIHLRH